MTEKQERILQAALELFAQEGYHATSTSRVARKAGVSEGLIFRHYGNKDGLLSAIVQVGEQRFKNLFANVVLETNPEEVIRKSLTLPFEVPEVEYEFWKLQYKLKWELKEYDSQKMQPMRLALVNAFKKRNSAQPEMEAELVLHILDGVATAILKGMVADKEQLKTFLLKKYKL